MSLLSPDLQDKLNYVHNDSLLNQEPLSSDSISGGGSGTVTVTFNDRSFMTPPESSLGGFNSVSKDSFLIFINGLEAEHEAWSITESGNNIVVTINETKIDFIIESSDEILLHGKHQAIE
tara:strand:- start:177 stop:536 length:360 start_codon:yes stop_codon:yes gene_type:complete